MILVTGGTGLVGSHLLLELLSSEKKVRALYRTSQSLDAVLNVFSYSRSPEEATELFRRIDWVQGDITDIPSLEPVFQNVKTVYHCAALVTFDPSKDAELRKVNIEGTANVVNFSIRHGVEKFCFVSSIATLDERPNTTLITEKNHWNKERDHTMYAITKYGAEMEVWRASQEGIPVVIVNPGIIIGPGFWKSGSGEIFQKINKGLTYYIPKISGFIGVKDVARVMKELMEAPVQNEQFILVSENLSFKKVFTAASKSLDKPEPKNSLKPWMIYLGWIWEKISSPFSSKERKLSRGSAKTLFNDRYYDNKKVAETLEYQFEPMEAVIGWTANLYKKDLKKEQNPD